MQSGRQPVMGLHASASAQLLGREGIPGTAAGDSGPDRDGVVLAGEPTGDGDGPRIPGRWGEVWGEKGDWAGLLCSPWLLDTPEVLTPGLRAPSAPVGRSSMEPDRSWGRGEYRTGAQWEQGSVGETRQRLELCPAMQGDVSSGPVCTLQEMLPFGQTKVPLLLNPNEEDSKSLESPQLYLQANKKTMKVHMWQTLHSSVQKAFSYQCCVFAHVYKRMCVCVYV